MKKVTGAKVTGAVVALTMCLNSVPSTALAESESPRGGDIKAVSEAEERTEDSVSEESTPTEEVKADETEKADAEEQEEGISEGDTQEEESESEETNGNKNSEQAEKSKEEINQPTEEEKQPAQEAVALTVGNETAVQATEEAVAKIGEDEYETLDDAIEATLVEDSATISLLKDAVLSSEAITYCPLVIEMNGFSITGNIRASYDLTLKNGTVEGNVTVDASTEQGKFVMTAPADAEAAITGNLIVNSDCSANISGAKVGVKGDSVQIDTDEEVIISGTDKAVELKSAVIGSSKTIYGATTLDGEVSQAVFSDGTYKVGEEVAKKITNAAGGQVTPPVKSTISFAADSENKNVVAGNSVTFTVNYDGTKKLDAHVQKNGLVGIAITIKDNEDNTYTVTVTPKEDVAAGAYTVYVYEKDDRTVQAEAKLNITEAGAKVAIGDTTTYYATLAEILANKLTGGSTITLLKDEKNTSSGVIYINTDETGITLDLNGKSLYYSALYVGNLQGVSGGNSGKVTVISDEGNNDLSINVGTSGTLIFAPKSAGTRGNIFNEGGNIILSGGSITMSNSDTSKKITEFLADGYAYKSEKGNLVEYATAKSMYRTSSPYSILYVVQCDHNDIVTDDIGKINCKYCNKELEVSVEWKSIDGTTKYFKDLKTALTDSAVTSGTSGTLKLLEDDNGNSLTINSGNFDLDLNGKKINSVGIIGGTVNITNTAETTGEVLNLTIFNGQAKVTLGIGTKYSKIDATQPIGSMLVSGAVMKVDGTYATEAQLNSSVIGSVVEIVEIPLYIMREPIQNDLDSIVYGKAESGLLTFAFSESGVTLKYKIDSGDVVTEEVTSNGIDLSTETALWNLSAGEHTLTVSATYDGYTINRTYTFTVSQSESNISIDSYSSAVTYFDQIYVDGRVETTGTAATSTNTNNISTYSGDDTLTSNYVELYAGETTYGKFAVNDNGNFRISLPASDLGIGELEFGVKYTGNENMADTQTADNVIQVKIVKLVPNVTSSGWRGYPYGKTYDGTAIKSPSEGNGLTIEYSNEVNDTVKTDYSNTYYKLEDIKFNYYPAEKQSDGSYKKTSATALAGNPVNAGDYIVEAVFDETDGIQGAISQFGFTINPAEGYNDTAPTFDKTVFITGVERTYEIDLRDLLKDVKGITENDKIEAYVGYLDAITLNTGCFKEAKIENGKLILTAIPMKNYKDSTSIGNIKLNLKTTNYKILSTDIYFKTESKPEKTINSNYITMDSWTYGEKPKEPLLSVITEGHIASTDAVSYAKKDGTALNGVPTDAGEYTVTISYETKDYLYKGTKAFTIYPKSIEGAEVKLNHDSFVYNGEEQLPEVISVVLDGVTLTQGINDDYGYAVNTEMNVGAYTLTVLANDHNYTGTVEVPWSITAKDMTNADATVAGGNVYTGENIEPEITIKDGSKKLVKGTDYDVAYSNNTNAGTANADITFKGNYSGNIKKTFEIARKNVTADIEVTGTYTYTGSEIKPTVVLKAGNTIIPVSEYNVSYESNTNAGTGKIIVTDKDGGNYEVNRIEETFTIEKAEGKATAPTAIENIVYNGNEQVLVNAGSSSTGEMQYKIGENGTYTAELPKAVNAGEYTVFYKSVGDNNHNDTEEGSITVSIARKNIADATVNLDHDSFVYNGENQYPEIESVVLDGRTLVLGPDYGSEITYGSDAGTYTVTVSANGNNYTGSVTVNWSITPKPVTATLEVTGTYTYTGSAIVPTVVVKEDIPENEYTLSYENNTNAGAGKVIVVDGEGGNYTVSGETTFTIKPAQVIIKALDKSIRKGNTAPDLSNPVAGTDYEVTGLIGDDVLGGTVSLRYSDDLNTGAVGTAEIIPSVTGINPNYEAVYEKGTLQIRKRPSSSDDSDSTVSNPVETPSTDNGKADSSADGTKQEDGIKQTVVKMWIDSKNLSVNGVISEKDAAPVIRNDRTLVPIRFITESLGGKVAWNGITKTVTLTIDGKEIKMTIGKTLEKYGVAPVIIDGRTFVPVRFVADELGAAVAWDDATKTVTITK